MKKQITRLSPHQNGKVVGVLMAVTSLLFVIPVGLVMLFTVPGVDQHGHATEDFVVLVLMPVFYLVFSYVATAIGCAIYNFFYKYIGGFEFELMDESR